MAENPLNPSNLISSYPTQSYQPMLQESIQHFLAQLQAGISDFSHFNLMFSRLIQTMPSPPLEVIWFYSAVNLHAQKIVTTTHDDKFGIVLSLKELFHMLTSCSGPCSGSLKKIAVLAPLVFELYSFVCELRVEPGPSLDVGIRNEIECLVEGLVSFVSLCCCRGVDDDHDDTVAFSPCFVDLVKVWTVRRREGDFVFEDDVRLFLPLVSENVRKSLLVSGSVGVLAGVVMCQVAFLSLCLKFGLEEPSKKLEEVVLNSAVNTITGFRSCYFFDTLLKVMLESSLPVTSLLNAADEVLLQNVLFDAIILVNYPFFNPECGVRLCSNHLNRLASVWLFVADKAIKSARNIGDQTKVITYTKAFSQSLINSHLLRWVSNQIGAMEDANRPNLSTPEAFVDWLGQLRSQPSSADEDLLMLLDKAMHYSSEMIPLPDPYGCDKDFALDQKVVGDLEMTDSTDAMITSCNPSLATIDPRRKRKGGQDDDSIRLKLLKYHDSPIKDFPLIPNNVSLIRRNWGEGSSSM